MISLHFLTWLWRKTSCDMINFRLQCNNDIHSTCYCVWHVKNVGWDTHEYMHLYMVFKFFEGKLECLGKGVQGTMTRVVSFKPKF